MEKLIKFLPAYDKRHSDPNKNYGIHGVDLKFILKGSKGAVQFVVFTNWQLPHVKEEFIKKPIHDRYDIEVRYLPMAADVGYHSLVPIYEGQEKISEDCEYTGGDCYYDGSSLWAEKLFDKFVAEGDEIVWKELEEYYIRTFGSLDE